MFFLMHEGTHIKFSDVTSCEIKCLIYELWWINELNKIKWQHLLVSTLWLISI
jgi:hypothetical protein